LLNRFDQFILLGESAQKVLRKTAGLIAQPMHLCF
jgi:hypothetical protein